MDIAPKQDNKGRTKADHSAFLEAVAEKLGEEPKPLKQKPELDAETVWYLSTFHLLSPSRSTGFGVGAIPLSEIINYGLVFDIIHDLESFCHIINRIDAAYIKKLNSDKLKTSKG